MNSEQVKCCALETPLGKAVACAESGAVSGFWFVGQRYFPKDAGLWIEDAGYPPLAALKGWLAGYFAGANPSPDFPLAPRGTPFQQAVWDILLAIPYGRLTTYGAIAKQLNERPGAPRTSARAVGGAVGHNPISLLIPCHRVIGASGKLTGYAGGIDKKQALLRLEGAVLL